MKLQRDYKATMELPLIEAFEAAVSIYIGQGYEKGASASPTEASFIGYKEPNPGILGKYKSAKTRQKKVDLSFTSTSNDKTEVVCKYTMPMSTGNEDWSKVREEVEALERIRAAPTKHLEVESDSSLK